MIPPQALQLAAWLRAKWWRIARPIVVGVRTIVLDDEDRVLLVRHTYGRPVWYLPGGGVKRGETLAAAAARELEEETGVVVDALTLDQLHVYTNTSQSKTDHIAVFLAGPGTWADHEHPASEIAERAFFPVTDLPEATSPGTQRRLAGLESGAPPPGPEW